MNRAIRKENIPFALLLTFCFLFLFSANAQAATLYWVGNAGAGTSTATNWKTTNPTICGSGDASAAPTSSDDIVFDADCDNGALVDAALNVNSITLSSGYAATVDNATNDHNITVAGNVSISTS